MRRFLVTGGAGFIGSHLVDALLARGDAVIVLDNLSTGRKANLAPDAKLILGDVLDSACVADCISQIDGCFHLAAISSVQGPQELMDRAHQVNSTGSINVFDAVADQATANAPLPVVFASSAAVYGDVPETPICEITACQPISTYGGDKLAIEAYARTTWERSSVPSIGLRLFNVYGPRQIASSSYSGVMSIFLDRLLAGEPVEIFGDGEQVRDFVYVSDAVAFLLAAMDQVSEGAEIFNVCTGRGITVNRIYEILRDLTGAGPAPIYRPARPGDIRKSVGDPRAAAQRFSLRADIPLSEGLQRLFRYRLDSHDGPASRFAQPEPD